MFHRGRMPGGRRLGAAPDDEAPNTNPTVIGYLGDSVQAGNGTPYGTGKAAASDVLRQAYGPRYTDVLLPNLFGEHGRPGYNSFVATFAHDAAAGRVPASLADRPIRLLHAQAALFVRDVLGLLAVERAPLAKSIFVRLVHDPAGNPVRLIRRFKLNLVDELKAEYVMRALVSVGSDVGNHVRQTIS